MTFKSFINKYGKQLSVIATIITIANGILENLKLMPGFMALIILTLGAILLIPSLIKLKGVSNTNKGITGAMFVIILLGFGYHFMFNDSKSEPGPIVYNNQTGTSNTLSSNSDVKIDQSSDNTNRDINNKKYNIEINAPITTKDNSHLTIANEINYNIPPQRHLTNKDKQDLKSLGSTNDNIQILYPPNNNEALLYAEEIFNKLFDLGYKNVSKGTSDNISKSDNKRFSIKQTKEESENIINIVINAQI
jgi:type III secretory pathway component EscV